MTRSRYSRKCSGSTPKRSREGSSDVRPSATALGRLPWDEVVEVAGRQAGLGGEAPVGQSGLGHQALDRRARTARRCNLPLASHQLRLPVLRRLNARSGIRRRSRGLCRSTAPSSSVFLPTVTRSGQPIRSASANFSPGRSVAVVEQDVEPSAESAAATSLADLHELGVVPAAATTTWTSYGAIAAGQTIPSSSSCCSTAAAMHAARADPVAAHHDRLLVAVLVQVRGAERLRVAACRSLKMWPTSIAVWKPSAPPQFGHASPSFGSRMSANRGW